MEDDDFGDLYADVEAQACSVFNSTLNCGSLSTEGRQEEDEDDRNVERPKEEGVLKADGSKNLGKLEADGSDSEDDLNIVLNDEDCEGFVVGSGRNGDEENGYDDHDHGGEEGLGKNAPGKDGLNPSGDGYGERGNGVKGGQSLQYSQYKHQHPYGSSFPSNRKGNESSGTGSCLSKSVRGDWEDNRCKQWRPLNSLVSQGGYGFSLPWYRTILDVDIDAFEEKPWRYPGADLSAFFNFGFNEDSWKQYCISMEQARQQSSMPNKNRMHQLSKLYHPYEIRHEHERVAQEGDSSSKATEKGEGDIEMPQGRAIQVRDSTGDRQSTMDLSRPHVWDSDVVIQINVQDSNEISAFSGEGGHMDIRKHTASTCKDLHVDDIRENQYSQSGSKDEVSAGSPGGNVRHSLPTSESDQMSPDPGNHDNDHVQISCTEDVLEVLKTVDMAEKESDGNIPKTDHQEMEPTLSLDERSHFSATISYSTSDVGTSRHSGYGVCEDSPHTLRRQTPGPELQDSGASSHKTAKSNGIIKKSHISSNISRYRSSSSEGRKHQTDRVLRVASPISRGQPYVDRCRRIGRVDNVNYRNTEGFSNHRRRDFSRVYDDDRFGGRHVRDVYTKHSYRQCNKSSRDESKSQERRDWDEECFHQRHFKLDEEEDRRDWYDRRRGLSPQGIFPPDNCKSRRESLHDFKERDLKWRREGEKILGRKRINRDSFLDKKFVDTNGRYISFEKQRRDFFDRKHERHGPNAGRGATLLGKRVRRNDDPSMGLDSSWCMEIHDDYHNLHHEQLPSSPPTESYANNKRSWEDRRPPRSDMFESTFTGRHGRHRRQIYNGDRWNSGWVGSCNDIDNAVDGVTYPDSEVQLARRNYSLQSEVMHQAEFDSFLWHEDDELYVERISCSYGVIPRREAMDHKYRSHSNRVAFDNMKLERHKPRLIHGESDAKRVKKNYSLIYGGEHEQMTRWCRDPVDSIVEEGKSSRRQSHGGRSMLHYGNLDTEDLNFLEDQTVLKNSNGPHTGKAIQTDVLRVEADQDDSKWLDKFPVTEHNEDFDVEDGQIISEEPKTQNIEKIHVSKSGAPTRNVKRDFHSENASGKDSDREYDNQRILETMAKMEKRRERFKDPIVQKTEPEKTPMAVNDLAVDTVETKLERPARKRRWGGR